jgi:hypothetical protein
MKRKWYPVLLGTVALIGLCLWQRPKVSPIHAPVQNELSEPITASQLTERWLGTRATRPDPVNNDPLSERLGADLTIVLAETDAIRRDENVQVLVDSIGFDEIPAALQFLQRQEQIQMLQDLQVLLVRKGALSDPQSAAAWAQQMPAGVTRSASIAGVGVMWANQNLVEAARWASELAEGEDRENGLGHVAFEAARTQPIFALDLTARLAPNDVRDELVRHAARQWAAQDSPAAVAWTEEITNPILREQILADIAAAWGETDPDSAAALALQSLSGGKLQEDALIGIAQHWVQKEPDRTAAWVLEFPETLQQTALENVVKLWADKNAPQAQKWVASLPPGFQRDVAVNALATR